MASNSRRNATQRGPEEAEPADLLSSPGLMVFFLVYHADISVGLRAFHQIQAWKTSALSGPVGPHLDASRVI